MEFFRREVATGDYPHIAAMFDRQPDEADRADRAGQSEPTPAADRFQRGLNRLLDGLDAALGS